MTERIYSLKHGPISVQIEASKKFMAIFSRRIQNALIRESLDATGRFWADVFLPKRFSNYAKTVLGFNPSRAWENAKRSLTFTREDDKRAIAPQPTPLVYRGLMRKSALSRWRTDSKATAKKQTLIVRIPLGHPVKKHIADLITRVPRLELQRIVEVFSKELPKRINSEKATPRAAQRPSGRALPRAA